MVRLPETFQLSASESESHPKWDQFRELAEEFVQNDCTRILRAMEMEEFSEPDDKGCEGTLNMDLAVLSSTKRNYGIGGGCHFTKTEAGPPTKEAEVGA